MCLGIEHASTLAALDTHRYRQCHCGKLQSSIVLADASSIRAAMRRRSGPAHQSSMRRSSMPSGSNPAHRLSGGLGDRGRSEQSRHHASGTQEPEQIHQHHGTAAPAMPSQGGDATEYDGGMLAAASRAQAGQAEEDSEDGASPGNSSLSTVAE